MIKVEHLTKCYGDFLAVHDLSFEIEKGHVYGFLGPNGAGKSTTMNIMTGCLSATEGSVKIDGHDIWEEPKEAKKQIGYLPEQPPLYMNETPEEYLRFVGEAKGLKGQELHRQVEEVIAQTKIEDVRRRLISKLSKGYRQRVGIAQALLGDPQVIILDEPTVGLDPIQIIEIRDLIKQLGETHTVILSSHILSEVQTVCEKILIINKGRLVAFDTTANLEKMMLTSTELSFQTEASREETEQILEAFDAVTEWKAQETEDGMCRVTVEIGEADAKEVSRQLFFAFAKKERAISEMTTRKFSLEDVFLELTENETPKENMEQTTGNAAEAAEDETTGDVPEEAETEATEDTAEEAEVETTGDALEKAGAEVTEDAAEAAEAETEDGIPEKEREVEEE